MDDLDVLARGYGFRPQGKSNPMRSEAGDRRSASARSSFTAIYDDDQGGSGGDGRFFNGRPPKYYSYSDRNNSKSSSGVNDFDYDSIFNSSAAPASGGNNYNTRTTTSPVYDKPVYDDDIFNRLPRVKNKSVSSASMGRFDDDGFSSMASGPGWGSTGSSNTRIVEPDDLLGKLGRNEGDTRKSSSTSTGFEFLENLTRKEQVPEVKSSSRSSSSRGFDDILAAPGSGTTTNSKRPVSESSHDPKPSANVIDDPFVILESTSSPVSSIPGIFTDPLEQIGILGKSGTGKPDTSVAPDGVFDYLDPLNGFSTAATPFSPDKSRMGKEKSSLRSGSRVSEAQTAGNREHNLRSSVKQSESLLQRNATDESFQDSPRFYMPYVPAKAPKSVRQNASSPPRVSVNMNETNFQPDMSPQSEELAQQDDDVWLTVSEVPLFTQPTSAPPPSRPPPPVPRQTTKLETGSFPSYARNKSDDFASPPGYSAYSQNPHPSKGPTVSQIDELEDFARGSTHNCVDEVIFLSVEDKNASSAAVASAAAMKEAMDRAEAQFRHAKEVREREYAKVSKSQETTQVDKDEQAKLDAQERELRENQERLEKERREREEEEREKRRIERERERERERAREIENARARQAVERATREARERAAAEARLKAERAAQAGARERAERLAVQRAQAEARERAAADAKERAEKVAAEAREKANAEAREKEARDKEARDRAAAEARRQAERAATQRATNEAWERAAAEAREKNANAAHADQQRYDNNDLETIFGVARPSAPRPRASSPDTNTPNTFNTPNVRKPSTAVNIMDDLNSLTEGTTARVFQEIPGESEERRKTRWEREQRIRKRAEEAVIEKKERDRKAQQEQQERDKLAETVDIEIRRWAAGKEGNLRALLSTLQYMLWPECGWQPVSLTDLITGVSVKKVYRKATLCIHPDKVQQKGASSHQKYVAEKVFDLLKEAWNKFNSEELF